MQLRSLDNEHRSDRASVSEFSALERAAIRIGAAEGRRRPGGRFAPLIEAVTGRRGVRPLADPRLEALRRFAGAVRVQGAPHRRDTCRFGRAGFTIAQSFAVADLVARR